MSTAPSRAQYRTFVHLPFYERTAARVLSDAEQRWLEAALSADRFLGEVVRGTGGVRKIRVALPSVGKSRGARVIYFYRSTRETVYLILAYEKSAKKSISDDERNRMKKLTAMLEAEP